MTPPSTRHPYPRIPIPPFPFSAAFQHPPSHPYFPPSSSHRPSTKSDAAASDATRAILFALQRNMEILIMKNNILEKKLLDLESRTISSTHEILAKIDEIKPTTGL